MSQVKGFRLPEAKPGAQPGKSARTKAGLPDQEVHGPQALGSREPAGRERSTDPAVPQARVAEIPWKKIDGRLVSLTAPTSPEAHQYRVLGHQLERLRREGGLRLVAVTSPFAGDGKTTTSINVAATLAQAPGSRTLLVDCDLRLPAVAKYLRVEGVDAPGLSEAVQARLGLDAVMQRCPPRVDLWLLTAGRPPEDPYDVIRSPHFADLLEEARRRFDFVVIDTPPILPVPDGREIARWVDGFLVVVAAHRTPRPLLAEALGVLEPDKVVGLVLNGDDSFSSEYYRYYRGYGTAARQSSDLTPGEAADGASPDSPPSSHPSTIQE